MVGKVCIFLWLLVEGRHLVVFRSGYLDLAYLVWLQCRFALWRPGEAALCAGSWMEKQILMKSGLPSLPHLVPFVAALRVLTEKGVMFSAGIYQKSHCVCLWKRTAGYFCVFGRIYFMLKSLYLKGGQNFPIILKPHFMAGAPFTHLTPSMEQPYCWDSPEGIKSNKNLYINDIFANNYSQNSIFQTVFSKTFISVTGLTLWKHFQMFLGILLWRNNYYDVPNTFLLLWPHQ